MSTSKKKLLVFYNIIIWCASFLAQTKVIPYQELPTSSGAATGSGIYFGASMNQSVITVNFEGPADRWIALGLGSAMYTTDVFIYSNGQPGSTFTTAWKDFYNTSHNGSGVTLDASQDWTIVSTNTIASQRTVTATRSLTTGDVNDIAVSYSASALSLVWAKGASTDYTIAYHGSVNRAHGISLPWLSTPTASFSSLTTSICQGSSVTFSNLSTGGQTSYNWSFASGNPAISTATNPVITYASPGSYSVHLTSTNALGTSTFSQVNYITVTPTISASTSIFLSSGTNPACSGSPVTFSASAVNGGVSPSYQWKINGINTGANSPAFSTSALGSGASITCVVTSNATCPNPLSPISAAISMTINSSAPASVTTSLISGINPMCNGSFAAFQAAVANGGPAPVYQWQVNGLNVGTTSATYTSNTITNGAIVTCNITSNAICVSSNTATSSGITMTVSSSLTPSIGVTMVTGNNPLCSGASASFSASTLNIGLSPTYQWQINGISLGINSPSFNPGAFNTNSIVTCIVISGLSCASPTSAASVPITVTVNPTPPQPSISPSGTIELCAGASAVLISSSALGTLWSSGQSSQTVLINTPGSYSVTQTSNGCISLPSAITHVYVFSTPTVALDPIGPFCADGPQILISGLPAGGTLSGTGLSGNLFTPSLAIPGQNNFVTYTYSQPVSNLTTCSDTAAINIVVLACTRISKDKKETDLIFIYPNPGSGEFKVDCSTHKITKITINDLSGRVVLLSSPEASTFSFSLENQPAGVYIAEILLGQSIFRSRIHKID